MGSAAVAQTRGIRRQTRGAKWGTAHRGRDHDIPEVGWTPTQYAESRGGSQRPGEIRLLVAILEDVYITLRRGVPTRKNNRYDHGIHSLSAYRAAVEFLTDGGPGDGGLFTLDDICEYLGWNPVVVRRGLEAARVEGERRCLRLVEREGRTQ